MSKLSILKKMAKITKKDKFTLYVYLIILMSSLFAVATMYILEKWNEYKEFNYLLFLAIAFILSGLISSAIITRLNTRTKIREELFLTLMEKVSNGEFNFSFPETKNEQLNDDIKKFNTILKQLNSVKILKEDFISNFSHEFKTPITSIKGFAEILQSKPNISEKDRQEYLQIIIDESAKLSNLSKNILLMGKLDSQFVQENKEVYLLNDQIAEIIFMLDNEITQKKINTEISLEKIKINASKELIAHIWINLLTNAIKFTKDEISIKSYLEGNFIVVKISDNGIGIKEEDLSHIFDKYYQAESNKKKNGNGLGLSIVKKVLEIVNGKIVFSSLHRSLVREILIKY